MARVVSSLFTASYSRTQNFQRSVVRQSASFSAPVVWKSSRVAMRPAHVKGSGKVGM